MLKYFVIEAVHSAGLVGEARHMMASQASFVSPVRTSCALAASGAHVVAAITDAAIIAFNFMMFHSR